MTSASAKPPYNAKRRIQWLFGFTVFLIVAATAAWFFVAGKIDDVAAHVIEQQAAAGTVIDCDNRDVRGYPFRFGLFCDSLSASNDAGGFSVRAGAVRSAAQFYDPRKLVVEIDGPMMVDLPSGDMLKVAWSQMRSTGVLTEPLPEHISIIGDDVVMTHPDGTILAKKMEAFMRIVGQELDLAGRTADLDFQVALPQLDDLPPLGVDFDIRVKDGASLLMNHPVVLRGHEGTLKRAAVLLNDDSGILISGPFSVDDDGLIDAEFTVRIIDVDAVFDVLEKAVPNAAPMLSAFAEGQPRIGDKGDEVELTISIAKSQIRMGFIPLGKLRPL